MRNGEEGPDSSIPFDNLDDVLEGLAAMGEDPVSYRVAMRTEYKERWLDACRTEIKGIEEMKVFTLVLRSEVPKDRKVLKGKWVLTVKRDKAGIPVRFKAQYVLCGYDQILGRDYNQTTSPTA